MSHPTNPKYRYRTRVTHAMIRNSAQSVVVVCKGYTQCPVCNHWFKDELVINGEFPEHPFKMRGNVPCSYFKR